MENAPCSIRVEGLKTGKKNTKNPYSFENNNSIKSEPHSLLQLQLEQGNIDHLALQAEAEKDRNSYKEITSRQDC